MPPWVWDLPESIPLLSGEDIPYPELRLRSYSLLSCNLQYEIQDTIGITGFGRMSDGKRNLEVRFMT